MRPIVLALILIGVPCAALAADPPAAKPARAPELDVLALEEGVWDAKIQFPANAAGEVPAPLTGVQTNTFVTGRGWIKNDFDVDAKYGGHGTWGWDPRKAKFVGIWVDANTDYIRFDEGVWDAAAHTMSWSSELRQPDPYPPAKFHMVEKFLGDTRTLEMSAISPKSGRTVPLGTITFTRRATH